MHSQLICGLIVREEILWFCCSAPSGLVRVNQFFQENWKLLVDDIATGTLNQKISDPSIRECMAKILRRDPQLAEFITKECAQDNWQGIIKRIWPKTKFIHSIVTGYTSQYIPTIEYFCDGLPFVCNFYNSSECHFGYNLSPKSQPADVSYTLLPNVVFFEFLPCNCDKTSFTSWQQNLLELLDVEVDKEYGVIITTCPGLHRYQVGDIHRVTGFHNPAPQFRFVKRKNLVLSIDHEKTDEADLQRAVQNASSLLEKFNTSIVAYINYGDNKTTTPGHYVVFLELLVKDSNNQPTEEVMNRCCLAMEESLGSIYKFLVVVDKGN